ncbi:MAG TPA: plastocyanin/azurin family copper-binding protein [Solirubrobacteraceae bacterium]
MLQPTRPLCAAALAATAALALAACGSSGSSGTSSSGGSAAAGGYGSAAPKTTTTTAAAAPAAAGATTVNLTADPGGALKFDTSTLAAKAGKVTVLMKNPSGSGLPHGIAVQGNGVDKDGATVQPGGTSTDTLTLKPGTYTFYCPVPGHKAAGMKGTLTVT